VAVTVISALTTVLTIRRIKDPAIQVLALTKVEEGVDLAVICCRLLGNLDITVLAVPIFWLRYSA
jgi:hypothetical protein